MDHQIRISDRFSFQLGSREKNPILDAEASNYRIVLFARTETFARPRIALCSRIISHGCLPRKTVSQPFFPVAVDVSPPSAFHSGESSSDSRKRGGST